MHRPTISMDVTQTIPDKPCQATSMTSRKSCLANFPTTPDTEDGSVLPYRLSVPLSVKYEDIAFNTVVPGGPTRSRVQLGFFAGFKQKAANA